MRRTLSAILAMSAVPLLGHAATPVCAPTLSQNFANGMGLFATGSDWAQCGSISADMTSYVVSQSCGAGNDPAANVYQTGANGLTLQVKPTPASVAGQVNDAPFIGSEITAKSTPQLYGYFQITASLPTAAGLNPAFWLLPANGAWPPELDVVEMPTGNAGGGNIAYQSLHSTTFGGGGMTQGHATINNPEAMHTYAVDWQANTITWYVDGVQTYQAPTPADLHQPMYMLADLFSGTSSSWMGQPKPGETAGMTIQSIQAFASNPYTSTTCTAPTTLPPTSLPPTSLPAPFQQDNRIDPAVQAAQEAEIAAAEAAYAAAIQDAAKTEQSVDDAIKASQSVKPSHPGIAVAAPPVTQPCQAVTAPQLNPGPLSVMQVAALAASGGIDPSTGPVMPTTASAGCHTFGGH